MSDSIKNKITRAAQVSGYKTVAHGDTGTGTTERDYINIPWGAVVTDVNIITTTAFAGGTTTWLVGTGVATVTNQDSGSTQTADPNGFLDMSVTTYNSATVGKKINAAAAPTTSTGEGVANDISCGGVLLGTKPPYSVSSTYGSNGEEKVVPVVLNQVQASSTSTAGALIWWVEYMFPANIVWLQASI
tara:strand:+ start:288 stop:851 length:564 start_codon:yes stop_codon:yes gene_type:complete